MGTSPPRRMPRAERRGQILSAAASAFVVSGFDGTSMDEVARAAGVTRLIVYRIFESKFELYTAVLVQVTDDLRGAFEPVPGRGEVARVVLEVARRHPDAFRLLWRQSAHEPEFSGLATTFRALTYDFAEGLIAPTVADPVLRHWAARSVVGYLYEGVCLWLDEGNEAQDDDVARALRDGVRAMVNAWARPT
jgi:AcrR family transcriptional regulator